MTRNEDFMVWGLLTGPYLLIIVLIVWNATILRRIKRLERKNDLESIQWRER